MVAGWDLAGVIAIAIGVLALCEVIARGVFAPGTPAGQRAGWALAGVIVAFALQVAAAARSDPFRLDPAAFHAHVALAVLWTICVHGWHALRRAPGLPPFLRSNAMALLGAAPWCASASVGRWNTLDVYATGLVGLALASVPARRAWAWAARIVEERWPVQEEIVGARMWRFVRPRAVLVAFLLMVIVAALVEPAGTVGVANVVGVPLVVMVVARGGYLLFRRLSDPLRERRIWYRPRPEASFALIEALAGAAIAIGAISVACDAMVIRQHRAADAALEAVAEEALLAGMEATWTRSARELAAAEGTARIPSPGLPGGELETTVARDAEGGLWVVRVTIRWKAGSGAVRSRTLETLRSEAGGRR